MRKNHSWLKRVLLTVNGVLIIMVHNVSIAADNSGSEAVYQSVFEDYKSDSTQGVSNWTKIQLHPTVTLGMICKKCKRSRLFHPLLQSLSLRCSLTTCCINMTQTCKAWI